jgi:hypothetical protein
VRLHPGFPFDRFAVTFYHADLARNLSPAGIFFCGFSVSEARRTLSNFKDVSKRAHLTNSIAFVANVYSGFRGIWCAEHFSLLYTPNARLFVITGLAGTEA